MQLFDSTSSPFVRKVNVVIHTLGLDALIERRSQSAHPIDRDPVVVSHNPLGQVPVLVLGDGSALCDSRVICEYLDALGGGAIFPHDPAARWRALTLQSIADGLLDAAILIRYENNARPSERQWNGWIDAQWAKIESVLEAIDREAHGFGERLDIGTITCGCALGYLDFRFDERRWRDRHSAAAAWFARFERHPAMRATLPQPRTIASAGSQCLPTR